VIKNTDTIQIASKNKNTGSCSEIQVFFVFLIVFNTFDRYNLSYMKSNLYFLIAFGIFSGGMSSAQTPMHKNMSLLAHWTDNTMPTNWLGGRFSDCWGYADSLKNEYAVIGSTMGTHILNITNVSFPPVMISFQSGREASGSVVHRDYKTYGHYLYGVCDEGNSSLQIFDLRYLPDSVHKIYDSQHICKTAHNIFIENGRLYFAGLRDSAGTAIVLRVASLSNPENPVILNDLASQPFKYVHDVYVRHDTAFLSAATDGLFIYDYTKPSAPVQIGSITQYPEQGYNHSSWVSADGKTLVFADEDHGKGLKVYDISDMSNITLKSIFRSNLNKDSSNAGKGLSIPHNPFIVGNDKVFISYYQDGVQCFDISNNSKPFQAGYYDTHPEDTDYNGYGPGCWGVYPFLPSRHIIGSDIANGLFILNGDTLLGVHDRADFNPDILVFPNPSNQALMITSKEPADRQMKIDVYDSFGKIVLNLPTYTAGEPIDISGLHAGIYLLSISGNKFSATKKIIKTN
jgi:choice-of-anchor B domain-containing protein